MMRLCARRDLSRLSNRSNHICFNYTSFALSLSQCLRSESHHYFSTKNNNKNNNPYKNARNSDQRTSSQRQDSNRQKFQGTGKAKIRELEQQMIGFRQRLFQLPALPTVWSSSDVKPDEGYSTLVADARGFIDQLQQAIDQGQLDQRYMREVSFLLEQSLMLFRTSYSDCQRVMSLAKKLNLNITHQKPALEAACLEGRWDEASNLFSRQINPDIAGFMPMEISAKEPLGLYAIARDAQKRKIPVAEQVMDAVMNLTMVNPTDQNNYVLAAGTALGRVGAWKELIDYQANSYNSARLGQSLIGAVMYACILNDQRDEALNQFAKLGDGPGGVSSEWQWSGGADIIDPIVRDIAMRAGGPQSLALFRQAKDEGFQVSAQALRAVVGSCSGLADVFGIIDHLCHDRSWLVDGDNLNIVHSDERKRSMEARPEHLEAIILPILRHCNHAGEFGLSLLFYELMAPIQSKREENWQHELVRRISGCRHRDETLAAIMTALCGLDSTGVACFLFENVVEGNIDQYPFSSDLYQYAKSIVATSDRWLTAHAMIVQLTHAVGDLPNTPLTSKQTDTLLAALAKAAEACNNAGQPEAAICLMRQVQKKVLSLQKVKPSMEGAVRSFLGIDPVEVPEYSILAKSDPVLAESIRAHRLRQASEQALTLFETVRNESNSSYESIPLSVNQALEALIDVGRLGQAVELFQAINQSSWTPGMFVTLTKALGKEQRWSRIGDLYHLSLKSGCLTEHVGIIAMKAVVESPEFDGKIRVLRGIVKEICSFTGLVENEWQYSRYWSLKQSLGIRYSRLLMWWNDQRTSDLFELQLAIEQLYESKTVGNRPNVGILWAIVRHCRHYKKLAALISELEMKLPVEKEAWADLLGHVIVELDTTPLWNDKIFVEEVIVALRTVEAHSACDEFVSDAVRRGVRVDKSLLSRTKGQ